MKKQIAALLLCALVSGCATSSGVVKMGLDTYSINVVAAPARGGVAGAKRIAYEEANESCAKTGKELLVVNERLARTSDAGGGTIDLTFRCLNKGDPELAKRPEIRDRPDVIIQDQRR